MYDKSWSLQDSFIYCSFLLQAQNLRKQKKI